MVSTAARVGSINVLLSTQFGGAVQGLNTFARAVETTGTRTQRAVGGIDRSVMGMNRSMASITGHSAGFRGMMVSALRTRDAIGQMNMVLLATGTLLGGLAPALTGAYFVRMADRAHLVSNNLRTVSESTAELKGLTEELFQVAQRSRASFEATAIIYARTARATQHLGMSQAELLRMTETVQKAFAVGGATTQEAWGAAVQLSQGIASDRFSGEEFRSVAENAPVLLTAMARAMGKTIGQLREMAHAGELNARTVTQAILDATEEVEAGFEKTTSTIGQAMTQLDNAMLKYVSDSENFSAGSMTIVAAINAVTNNIDTLVDSLALLGTAFVAVMAGRPLNSLRQNIAAQGQYLNAVRSSTAETMKLAQAHAQSMKSEWIAQRLAFNRALMDGNYTAKQLERQKNALIETTRRYHAATNEAAIATNAHAVALQNASRSGRLFATTGRIAAGAWSFIGGTFGAVLLGLGAAFYVVASHAADAAERMRRIAAAAEDVAGQIGKISEMGVATGDVITRFADGFAKLLRTEGIARAQAEFKKLGDGVKDVGLQMQELARQAGAASGSISLSYGLRVLTSQFQVGAVSLDEYISKLQDISRANPDLSRTIADLIDVARQADEAKDALSVAERQLQAMDGQTAKMTLLMEYKDLGVGQKQGRVGLSEMDIEQARFDEAQQMASRIGWDEFFKFPKEKRSRGSGRRRKDADDRFAESIQAIRDRTAAIIEEQQAFGRSYYQQEQRRVALELEQSALKAVREEARRKGEQDWMNASLTPSQISQIHEVSNAYAEQADRLRVISEQHELYRDIMSGVFSDLRSALEDGKITVEEFGQVFINVLNKITDKLLNDVIDALMQVISAGQGGGGIFGMLGGLLGIGGGTTKFAGGILSGSIVGLFHDGGDAGNPRRFRAVSGVNPSALPKYHSGRSGVGHNEVMALLEKSESVFTSGQTARIADALASTTQNIKDDGSSSEVIQIAVTVSGARGNREIEEMVASGVRQGISGYDRLRGKRYEAGGRFG